LSAHSKNAWLAFGLCLTAAGTAYAAIPDANGVIHGCYNVVTGSTKIIDGNSCGFLEKAITWQQTGPRGPAGTPGPQGPAGPQGAAGTNNIVVGHATLIVNNPVLPQYGTTGYTDDFAVTAPNNGFCNLTVSATMLEATGELSFRVSTRRDDGRGVVYQQTGHLDVWDHPSTGSDIKFEGGGTVMDSVSVEAGHSYHFGVELDSLAGATIAKPVFLSLGWVCQFES
jgi:hypothetical protein